MGYCKLPLAHFSCKAQHFRRKLSCPDRDRNLLQSHQMLCHCCAINQVAEALAEPMLPSDQDLHPLEKVKYNGAALMACLTFSWGGGESENRQSANQGMGSDMDKIQQLRV